MKIRPNQTLLQTIDQYPPFLIYALSRTGRPGATARRRGNRGQANFSVKRLPIEKLAARGGLSIRTFTRIMVRITWADVRVRDIEKFCTGCGINLLQMQRHVKYIRVTLTQGKMERWPHLNPQQWRTFCRLGKRWHSTRAAKA